MAIPLNDGTVTIVDAADFDWLIRWKWRAHSGSGGERDRNRKARPTYAVTTIKGKNVSMHRLIMDAKPGSIIDHINRNPLDNRRSNLRFVTNAQNMRNTIGNLGKSGFRGTRYEKRRKKWIAVYHIGTYDTIEEAARAYDRIARLQADGFVLLNFPDEDENGIKPQTTA